MTREKGFIKSQNRKIAQETSFSGIMLDLIYQELIKYTSRKTGVKHEASCQINVKFWFFNSNRDERVFIHCLDQVYTSLDEFNRN